MDICSTGMHRKRLGVDVRSIGWAGPRCARSSGFRLQAVAMTVRMFRSTACQLVLYWTATFGYSHFVTSRSRSGSRAQRYAAYKTW